MSINRVAISGNLTRDAEIRMSQSGTAIVGFGVAVNDRKKNSQTGEWEDYANFVDCTMFGPRAEKVQPYLEKGVKVAVEGKLRYSSWEKDGQKRSKIEVIVDEIEFMSRGAQRVQESQQYDAGYIQDGNYARDRVSEPLNQFQQAQARAQQAVAAMNSSSPQVGSQEYMQSVYDEDIPF